MISSKNIAILARDRKDFDLYKTDKAKLGGKYAGTILKGELFFDAIDNVDQKKLKELK